MKNYNIFTLRGDTETNDVDVCTTLGLPLEQLHKDEKGNVLWSNHWAASRVGVSQSDYEKLLRRQTPPKNYNKDDPAHVQRFEVAKQKAAQEEIQNKLQAMMFDIQNAEMHSEPHPMRNLEGSLLDPSFYARTVDQTCQ